MGDSTVDTVTRYGLDSPGCESRWGKRDFLFFYTLPDRSWHLPSSLFNGTPRPRRQHNPPKRR